MRRFKNNLTTTIGSKILTSILASLLVFANIFTVFASPVNGNIAPVLAEEDSGDIQPFYFTSNYLVYTARQHVGKVPYKYGGNDTNGWDCSGFVCYVFNQRGINLWPWRSTLKNATANGAYFTSMTNYNSISSTCQQGDILIFSGHVAIYSGSGNMIHALPNHGTVETPATRVWVGSDLKGYVRIPNILDY